MIFQWELPSLGIPFRNPIFERGDQNGRAQESWAPLPSWTHQNYNYNNISRDFSWNWDGNQYDGPSTVKAVNKDPHGDWKEMSKSDLVGTAPLEEDSEEVGGYHRLRKPPLGLKSLSIQGLRSNNWKQASLVGLKTNGAYWTAIWNQASALEECMLRLSYSQLQQGSSKSKTICGSHWLARNTTASPHPQPTLGSCFSLSCSSTAPHQGRGWN